MKYRELIRRVESRIFTYLLVIGVFVFAFGIFKLFFVTAADVAIDTSINTTHASFNNTSPTVVFTDDQEGYSFYVDSGGDCVYSKTTDGGDSWNTAVRADSVNTADCFRVAVWYDQWTPSDSGTIVHIATVDTGSDHTYYTQLDTSNDSLSTTIDTSAGQNANLNVNDTLHSITKGTDGKLYIAANTVNNSWVVSCTSTCTSAANWSAITNPLDNKHDWLLLMPLPSANIMLIRMDLDANDYDYRTWNGSSWSSSWVSITTTSGENVTYKGHFGATVTSLGDIYLTYVNDNGTLGTDDDIGTAVYSGGSWSSGASVLTNDSRGITNAKIGYDETTGDVYVFYSLQTTAGTASTGNVYYKRSTDNMSSWESEIQLNDTADDIYGSGVNIVSPDRIYGTWKRVSIDDLYGDTIVDSLPTEFEQSAYRWFNNANSADVGSSLAAQNTAASAPAQGTLFRLRALIHISGGSLTLNEQSFKIQVASMSGTCDTGFSGESYADVSPSSGEIRFADNSNVSDGDSLTSNNNDPAHGSDTVSNQDYEEANSFTNSTSQITADQDGKWDFVLVDNSAPAGKNFCFRIVKNDGSLLDTYSVIPRITTAEVITSNVAASTIGTQIADLNIPSTDQYVGGIFVLTEQTSSRNITGITIAENGTVNGSTNISNIKLYYDLDTSLPYNCQSESFAGSETQFGSTDTNGFSGADGTSSFTGSVGVSTTSTMCVYAVLDIGSGAGNSETLEIEISNPSTDITLSAGTVGPDTPVALVDITSLLTGVDLQQIHYRWRNDDGTEIAFNKGTGADGSVTISSQKNINTEVLGSARTTNADGISTTVSSFGSASGGTTLTVASATGLAADDEIILINLQGDSTNSNNVGNYEFLKIQSISTNTLTFISTIQNIYGATSSNLTLTGQKIMLQRVPQWTNVTINSGGRMIANDWSGTSGGMIVFRATGTVTVNSGGSIQADGLGYRGGSLDAPDVAQASFQGESRQAGLDTRSQSANDGAGGGGFADRDTNASTCAGGAGGGGYGSGGQTATQSCGSRNGTGGASYGISDLSKIYLGSGGGSGGHDIDNADRSGGPGGDGGGVILIAANTVSVSGTITSNGGAGGAGAGSHWIGGGGGSGGSVMIQALSVTLGSSLVKSSGGADGSNSGMSSYVSGDGGDGRIRVESDSISGTTLPSASTSTTPTDPGATFAADQDTGLLNINKGVVRRVRVEISNEGGQVASSITFRLEVSEPNPANCAGATYTGIDTDTHWDMSASTFFTDGDNTTNIIPGLTDESSVFIAGKIKDTADQTTGISLAGDRFTELEYSIVSTNNAQDGATYCFRVTNAGSETSFSYSESKFPVVTLSGGPTISGLVFNNGDPIALIEGTTASVSATAIVSDPNGFGDFNTATRSAIFYRSGVGSGCTADNNNCYVIPVCTYSSCVGISCNLTCTAAMYYFADPTDIGGFSAQNWLARVTAYDITNQSDTDTSLSVELDTLFALDVATSSINYGSLDVGQDTGSTNSIARLRNTGNASINPQTSGTDMTGPSTIPVSRQKYLNTSFTYSSGGNILDTVAAWLGFSLNKPTSTTPVEADSFWGLGLPAVIQAGIYTGVVNFIAAP